MLIRVHSESSFSSSKSSVTQCSSGGRTVVSLAEDSAFWLYGFMSEVTDVHR